MFLILCPWLIETICRDTNTSVQVDIAITQGHHGFITVFKDHAFTFTTCFFHSQVVVTQDHILRWCYNWFSVFRIQDVLSSQHEDTSFSLSFFRQWNVNGHLVTVKVGIVGFTDQRVQAKSFTIDQNWLKGLDTQTVKGRCAVKEHWVFFDNIFQDIPDALIATLYHSLSGFHILCIVTGNNFPHDKRLEELNRHFTWHTTLIHFQCRTNSDNGTT